jgi:hypothetical protein
MMDYSSIQKCHSLSHVIIMIVSCYGTPEEAYDQDIQKHPDGFKNAEVDMHPAKVLHLDPLQGTPHVAGAISLFCQ